MKDSGFLTSKIKGKLNSIAKIGTKFKKGDVIGEIEFRNNNYYNLEIFKITAPCNGIIYKNIANINDELIKEQIIAEIKLL